MYFDDLQIFFHKKPPYRHIYFTFSDVSMSRKEVSIQIYP